MQRLFYGQQIEVKLYGSKARGKGTKDSDLDVLVIIPADDWHLSDRVYEVATDLLLESGVLISPKTISLNRFELLLEEGAPFLTNVIQDAVTV